SLRNVALTAPYGHNGAYRTLEGIVRHHLDPRGAFDAWQKDEAILPSAPWIEYKDFVSFEDSQERARLASRLDITPISLDDTEVAELVAFLETLTGDDSVKGRLGRPDAVPSGLEVQ
ncbi:MAG: methylamine utilization protein MauG, partial [Rhodobacteraceae bacterium]|nr:methylamine utilization protein MauG [Paracoccaceae bacterium]